MKNLLIYFLFVLVFASCDRLNGLDEGDRNTYTWRGTIYEGYSDKPLANQKVYLEVGYIGVGVGKEEIIGETTTDENGYYSITYRKIRKPSEGVALYVENGQYSNSPIKNEKVNKDVISDLATFNHARILLLLVGDLAPHDSLTIEPISLLESDYSYNKNFEPAPGGKYILITDQSVRSIEMKVGASAIKGDKIQSFAWYGIGISDWEAAKQSLYGDSVDARLKKFEYELSGFPDRDTIELVID